MPEVLSPEEKSTAPASLTRRSLLKGMLAGTAVLGLAGYAGLLEPSEVQISRIDIKIKRLPAAFDGFKIALVADLHFGPYTGEDEISHAVRTVNSLDVDAVAVVGDFVSEPLTGKKRAGAAKAAPCAAILAGMKSRHGTFAVLGNHDYGTDPEFVAEALSSHGIHLLRNTGFAIERDRTRLWFAGINDVLSHADRLDLAVKDIPAGEVSVLLCHEPDFADEASRYGINVQFSGHSHGGQVRLPGIRPPYLPELAQKYYEGYYRVNNLQLYTNRGIGTIGLPFRFFSPPEATLVTLRAA
jgi:predicted MPP superfamily phosphohydrolase